MTDTNNNRSSEPPSIIAIRSTGSSHGSRNKQQQEPQGGLDMDLIGVVQMREIKDSHSPSSGITPRATRRGSSKSGSAIMSFAMEEEDTADLQNENEEEEPREMSMSLCDLCAEDDDDEECQGHDHHHDHQQESGSCSVVMPLLEEYEEEDEDVLEDQEEATRHQDGVILMDQIRNALQNYSLPRPIGTSLSSDYWKGLLVGVFLCQSVFVPCWAAFSVSGTEGSSGILGFLFLMLKRVLVALVAGAGFVVMGVIAMEYERALQKELEGLRKQNKRFIREEAYTHVPPSVVRSQPEPRRRRISAPRRPQMQPQQQYQQPVATSVGDEPNNANRSVSVTAPSTTSEPGFDERKAPDTPGRQATATRKQQQLQLAIVNHTPDTMRMRKKEKSLTFSAHGPALPLLMGDLSEQSAAWTSATNPRTTNDSTLSIQKQSASSAEFYPNSTVLLAHISGFAAWSSQRNPDQVFHLLERLHQRFDEAAERLQVTKVETTSNSYMAVTGVPEEQEDHALVMVKFAKQILVSMVTIVTALEGTLGPDTMELRLRIGIHSGSITAGALGGRFQVFGNTVKTASIMESTSLRHRIQISEGTAELLQKADKGDWIQKREDPAAKPTADGNPTYFVLMTAPLSARGKSSYHSNKSNISLRSMRSTMSGVSCHTGFTVTDQQPQVPKRRQVWGDGEDNFVLSLPPMSRTAKNKRLITWVDKLLQIQLKKIVAQRGHTGTNGFEITNEVLDRVCHGVIPVEELADITVPSKPDLFSDKSTISTGDMTDATLDGKVASQLREMVTRIAGLYRDANPFHNFEHAAHTTMAVQKLLSRCISQDEDEGEVESSSKSAASRSVTRQYMSGVASDALCQFAVLFAALAHDCGHEGLSSRQLSRLKPELSEKYDHESVAEQNSIELAWEVLMDRGFHELHRCLFSNEGDVQRFRQVLVNAVLATDLSNGRAQGQRNRRWERSFHRSSDAQTHQEEDPAVKATVVLECLVQASDISHAMQHFKVYQKWNERFFREKSIAFDAGRSFCNPQATWFKEELDFMDKYAIPLAKKLSESNVFGVASSECLNHALNNRKAWADKGEKLVEEMYRRYCKRKEMEVGGFTNEEVNNFTAKELEYIMAKLVEKGRYKGTNHGRSKHADAERGQNDAAQAWMDALEINERCPAAMEVSDRSVIFPIYSGVFVWIKGDKILHDPDGYFELNLARKFVRESKLHLDPIHHTRALAMLSEVYGRQGHYELALEQFDKLKEIYSVEAHSLAVAEVYGTDRSAQAFSFSALWHDQLGNANRALAACEYVIQDLLPMLDPQNTLGNFELLFNVIRVLKPKGQEKRMRRLFDEYVVQAFLKHHGPKGFTPCRPLFEPLMWLLDICADPSNFPDLDDAVQWLMEEDNGVMDDFVDTLFVKQCWGANDIVSELCLRLANRLALEEGDLEQQRYLVQKGLMLAWRSEWKMRDMDGNVLFPIPYELHAPVFNALSAVAEQMGIDCKEMSQPRRLRNVLEVNLPPSYLQPPDENVSS